MPKKCTTHHKAYDCREETIKKVAREMIAAHEYLYRKCDCLLCQKARGLLK